MQQLKFSLFKKNKNFALQSLKKKRKEKDDAEKKKKKYQLKMYAVHSLCLLHECNNSKKQKPIKAKK